MRDLHAGASAAEQDEAVAELRTALLAKLQQLAAVIGQIRRHTQSVDSLVERIEQAQGGRLSAEDARALRAAAATVASLLEVVDERGLDQHPSDVQAG